MTTAVPDATPAPGPAPAWPQRAAIGLRWIAGFLVAVLAWVGLQVLDVWPAWVLAAVVGLALVLALPIWLIRRVRARGRPGWSAWRAYGSTALVVLVLLILVLATPIYYLALRGELRPAAVPQAVLSNGPKTVVFQGMVHIGSEPYYKGMVYEVGKALTEGSALFYEGVIESPESPEATQWFKDTLAGGGDLSANYKAIGNLCGLTFQLDWFAPVEAHKKLHPEQHVNADLSYLEMYREYQRLAAADPGFATRVAAKQAKGADPTDAALTWVVGAAKGASQEQKDLAGALCRGLFSHVFERMGPKGEVMDPVILDLRNRALAKRIQDWPGERIFITYGAAHLPGMLAELRKLDPAWEIKSLKWTRAIAAPEDVQGELIGSEAPGAAQAQGRRVK